MLLKYIKALFSYAGHRAWIALGMMLLLGLTQGIGLVMIIPFLHVIGIVSSNGVNGYAEKFIEIMAFIDAEPTMFSVICTYLIIVSIHAFGTRFKDMLTTQIVRGFAQYLENRIYSLFCNMDWLCFLRTRDSDITHVLTADIGRVAFATQQVFQLIVSAILVTIHILFSFSISVPMTLSALACGTVFLLVLRPFNKHAAHFGISLRDARNNLYELVTEHIGGMKVSKSYNLEAQHKKKFYATTETITRQMIQFTKINSATRMCYQIGAASAIAVFILIGVKWIHMPAVNLMVIVFLFSRILPGFSNLQQCFQKIVNSMPSFRAVLKMEEQFEAAAEADETVKVEELQQQQGPHGDNDEAYTNDHTHDTHPIAPIHGHIDRHVPLMNSQPFTLGKELRFDSVSFRYDKNRTDWTLNNIDFLIPADAMTAIAGHSGAGKSSVADLILGLLSPDKGQISIDGKILSDKLLQHWRKVVGYVPQETFLFHESIGKNLLKAHPDASESQLWDALEKASARTFVSNLPEGLDTIVGDRGVKLSGGERQRIALARALLRKPLLLLLDEATSSLDTENERHIQKALEKLQGKLTMVVIAHRFSTIENADHVVVLDQGKVSEKRTFLNKLKA